MRMRKAINFISFAVFAFCAAGAEPPELATELESDGEFGAAAAARRRQALLEDDPIRSAGYFYLAALNYSGEGRFTLSERMLDRAEDSAPDALAFPAAVLRAENAYAASDFASADFFFSSVENSAEADDEFVAYARRGQAASRILSWDIDGGASFFGENSDEWLAIQAYKRGSDKSPRLGGLLGIIPGLGYAYSGEYGNAVRSLILNSLFIWGMIETGERDQWGAFSVITFFELTWYTGSIYGGVDAANRRNRERLEGLVEHIRTDPIPVPEPSVIPVINLRFGF